MKAEALASAAEDWLLKSHPQATIVRELSVATWGGALVDVAAITDDEIIGVEIKGEGDSPTRLELQGLKYGAVCRRMWLLCTPDGTLADRCAKKRPHGWGQLTVDSEDGSVGPAIRFQSRNGLHQEFYDAKPSRNLVPWAMCGTLWRDELYDVAVAENLQPHRRERVEELTRKIINTLPLPKIHDRMIWSLRRRTWRGKIVIDKRPPPAPVHEKDLFG